MRLLFSLVLSGALAMSFGIAGAQNTDSPEADTLEAPRPDFQLLRQEETWHPWAEDAEGLASVKFIPLSRDGDAFLTLGGEARAYGRWYRNEQWGAVGPTSDAYLLQRLMLHGSVQTDLPPDWARLRVFTQLKSGIVTGRDGPLYPPDKDLLGVNQVFLEGQSRIGSQGTLTVRVGRQELHYGAGRMIAVREGPNVRLGFDAVLGRYQRGPWRVDAFAAKPNETAPGVLDNGWLTGRTLWGLYLSKRTGREGLSFYYVGTDRNPSPTARGLEATRHTLGARMYGTSGALTYDLEGAVQFGSYRRGSSPAGAGMSGRDRVHASTFAGRLAYRFDAMSGQPVLGMRASWSSGDDGDTRAHETFAAPYPSGRFTGAGSRLGPGNLIKTVPSLSVRLRGGIRLQVESYFFWRATRQDGIYAIWGAPLRSEASSDARWVGVMPEGTLTASVGRHVTLALEASYFDAGPVLRESGSGQDLGHIGIRASYVF